MELVFYAAAAVALASTVMAVTRLNAVHALLYLIVSLLSVAVIFFALGAPFVAAFEIVVYAGAIVVLFVFVVMLLNLGPQAIERERRLLDPRAWVGPSLLAAVLVVELIYVVTRGRAPTFAARVVDPRAAAVALLGPYLLAVELASLLLLAGLVGAYHVGRHGRARGSR